MKHLYKINDEILKKTVKSIPLILIQKWHYIAKEYHDKTTPLKIANNTLYIVAEREIASSVKHHEEDFVYRVNTLMGDDFILKIVIKQREFIF